MTAEFLTSIQVPLIVFCFVAVALFIGYFVYNHYNNSTRKTLEKRLNKVRYTKVTTVTKQGMDNILAQESFIGFKLIDDIFTSLIPQLSVMQKTLLRAGLKFSYGLYFTSVFCLFFIIFIAQIFLWDMPPLLSLFIAVSAGIGVPHFIIHKLSERRVNTFLSQLPEGLDLIIRAAKAGLPLSEAVRIAGNELPDPLGKEFKAISDNVKIGVSIEDALFKVSAHMGLTEFYLLSTAVSLQRETGGNLITTISNLAETIRKRQQIRLKIKALSSEAKASAIIVGSLPFIVIAAMMFLNPGYISKLFNDPRGVRLLTIAGGIMLTGILVMRKLTKIDL